MMSEFTIFTYLRSKALLLQSKNKINKEEIIWSAAIATPQCIQQASALISKTNPKASRECRTLVLVETQLQCQR